jgi:hypothetical protein
MWMVRFDGHFYLYNKKFNSDLYLQSIERHIK